MALVHKSSQVLYFTLYFSIILCCFPILASANRELDESNWKDVLEGEWMVIFHAPWCPACRALMPPWKQLSELATRKSLDVRTASIDVTKSPGLSGRFVVTQLPTIFHVKDGEFRQYKGSRIPESMVEFVEQQRWQQTDPVPSWKAPDSLQMTLVAEFFKLSQVLRNVHTILMEKYGLPTWGSYLIFAIATIFIGALLGLLVVCVIDLVYPPRRPQKVFVSKDELAAGDRPPAPAAPHEELINDDLVDDAEQADSEAEKNSPPDTSEDEKEKPSEGGDNKQEAKEDKPSDERPSEVRKRRPRKAD